MLAASKVKQIIKQVQAYYEFPEKKIYMKSDLYKNLEFDDIVFADLIFQLEENFGFELSDDELQHAKKVKTVKDVVKLVKSKKQLQILD